MRNSGRDPTLRPLLPRDASHIAELIGDWEVARWLAMPPYPYTVADAEAFVDRKIGSAAVSVRTVVIEVDGELAGLIGIDRSSGGLDLGYWLGRLYWGRGIMTRAAIILTGDFFAKTNETHLMSGYFSGNEASWAIQKRLGFEFAKDGMIMNRPQGKRLPHVTTQLTRARFERMQVV